MNELVQHIFTIRQDGTVECTVLLEGKILTRGYGDSEEEALAGISVRHVWIPKMNFPPSSGGVAC